MKAFKQGRLFLDKRKSSQIMRQLSRERSSMFTTEGKSRNVSAVILSCFVMSSLDKHDAKKLANAAL